MLLPKALGPRLGGNTQKVIGAHKAGDWSFDNGAVTVGGIDLVEGEFEFRLVSDAEGAAATLPVRAESLCSTLWSLRVGA